MDRRNFLKGILVASIAPAIIPYANLMKLGYKKTEVGVWTYQVNMTVDGWTTDLDNHVRVWQHDGEEHTEWANYLDFKIGEMECQSQRDQISLKMRTLSTSMNSESQGLLTCSVQENTLKKSLASPRKQLKKF